MSDLVTTTQLASRLGISRSTLQEWVRKDLVRTARRSKTGGRPHLFSDEGVEQARAIVRVGGLRAWKQDRVRIEGLLSSSDIIGATALTYRRLDYWVRIGLLTPLVDADGSGTQRLFDSSIIRIIEDMLERIEACPMEHP